MKSRFARVAVVLVAIGLIAAACGDDDEGGGGSSDGATPTGTCDPAKPSIKIGGVGQVAFFAGQDDGVNALIARENKTCIQGRKLEFIGIKDDGSDPQKNLDLNKSAVESDKVFAMINTSAVMLPQTTNYLADDQLSRRQEGPVLRVGLHAGILRQRSMGLQLQRLSQRLRLQQERCRLGAGRQAQLFPHRPGRGVREEGRRQDVDRLLQQ
jgi:hypothetical protein